MYKQKNLNYRENINFKNSKKNFWDPKAKTALSDIEVIS